MNTIKQENTMTRLRKILLGMCVAAASLGAMAQAADEHKDHHPAGSTPPTAAPNNVPAQPIGTEKMAGMTMMDEHMKVMQAMHEKMAAAKTPEERQALMAEHMKLMQDGMSMMKQMGCGMQGMGDMQGGKDMPPHMEDHQQMMEKCMEMMDRMPPATTR
jgi:hypothetical protein